MIARIDLKNAFLFVRGRLDITIVVSLYIVASLCISEFTGYAAISSHNHLSRVIYLIVAFVALRIFLSKMNKNIHTIGAHEIIIIISKLVALILLFGVFTSVKNAMSYFSDFNFDTYLADFDKFMHFGNDAWVPYSFIVNLLPYRAMDFIYLPIWMFLSIGVAVHCAIFEKNKEFQRRFLVGYAVVWIFLGNIVAYFFLSAGPIYYQSFVHDPHRFSGLIQLMAENNFEQTKTYLVQDFLLKAHAMNISDAGTGISAFPSVHVGMAAMTAFYLSAKWKHLKFLSVMYVIIIQISSVMTGYHYAVDGYFSLIFVALLWSFYVQPSSAKELVPQAAAAHTSGDQIGISAGE